MPQKAGLMSGVNFNPTRRKAVPPDVNTLLLSCTEENRTTTSIACLCAAACTERDPAAMPGAESSWTLTAEQSPCPSFLSACCQQDQGCLIQLAFLSHPSQQKSSFRCWKIFQVSLSPPVRWGLDFTSADLAAASFLPSFRLRIRVFSTGPQRRASKWDRTPELRAPDLSADCSVPRRIRQASTGGGRGGGL